MFYFSYLLTTLTQNVTVTVKAREDCPIRKVEDEKQAISYIEILQLSGVEARVIVVLFFFLHEMCIISSP